MPILRKTNLELKRRQLPQNLIKPSSCVEIFQALINDFSRGDAVCREVRCYYFCKREAERYATQFQCTLDGLKSKSDLVHDEPAKEFISLLQATLFGDRDCSMINLYQICKAINHIDCIDDRNSAECKGELEFVVEKMIQMLLTKQAMDKEMTRRPLSILSQLFYGNPTYDEASQSLGVLLETCQGMNFKGSRSCDLCYFPTKHSFCTFPLEHRKG